jgi:hypothetical protein
VSGWNRRQIGVRAYLVLRSVMVFDAFILIMVAGLLWAFMQHPAGIIGAALCCLTAGVSLGAGRWLDRLYDQGG